MAWDNSNYEEQTVFNQGIATLFRMDDALKGANMSTVTANYQNHLRVLRVLFKELSPFMKDEEYAEHQTQQTKCIKFYNLYLSTKKKGGQIDKNFIYYFDDWEIMLRRIMKKKGLLMPAKDDPGLALGGKNF